MIRALAIGLAGLMLAPAALAQAVPPRQQPGPPVELAGSDAPPTPEPTTPAIPGGMDPLPKPRFVGPPKPEPPVFGDRAKSAIDLSNKGVKVGSKAASAVETGAKLSQQNYERLNDAQQSYETFVTRPSVDPQDETYAITAKERGDLAGKAKVAGNIAKGVSMATSTLDTAQKCSGPNIDTFECSKSGVSMGSSYAGGVEMITESPVAGKVAKGLSAAADTMTAYQKCSDPKYSQTECGYATLKVVADVAGFVPGPASSLSTAWALGTAGGEFINSLAPDASVKLYDLIYANENVIKDATPAQLEELKRRRHAAYERSKSELVSKQEAYDAEEARRQADALAASQRAGNSSGGVNFLNALLAGLPNAGVAAGYGAPAYPVENNWCIANPVSCASGKHPGTAFDAPTRAPAPAPKAPAPPAPRPPQVDTSCHPPPGKVCTAN